jgi:hypothetical protein
VLSGDGYRGRGPVGLVGSEFDRLAARDCCEDLGGFFAEGERPALLRISLSWSRRVSASSLTVPLAPRWSSEDHDCPGSRKKG